jgi:hypothetical protein
MEKIEKVEKDLGEVKKLIEKLILIYGSSRV